MIKNGDNVILKFSILDGELSRYKGKAYIYESMENATKYCYHNEILVEYAPVKHGKWYVDKSFMPFISTCSECGATYDIDGAFDWKFCPICGARMDAQ